MKKLFALLLLISLASSIEAHCGACNVGRLTEKKKTSFHNKYDIQKLTSQQQKKLDQLNQKYHAEERLLIEKKQRLDKKYYNDIEDILTPTQLNEYLIQKLSK